MFRVTTRVVRKVLPTVRNGPAWPTRPSKRIYPHSHELTSICRPFCLQGLKLPGSDAHNVWLEPESILSESIQSVAYKKKPDGGKEGISNYGQTETR